MADWLDDIISGEIEIKKVSSDNFDAAARYASATDSSRKTQLKNADVNTIKQPEGSPLITECASVPESVHTEVLVVDTNITPSTTQSQVVVAKEAEKEGRPVRLSKVSKKPLPPPKIIPPTYKATKRDDRPVIQNCLRLFVLASEDMFESSHALIEEFGESDGVRSLYATHGLSLEVRQISLASTTALEDFVGRCTKKDAVVALLGKKYGGISKRAASVTAKLTVGGKPPEHTKISVLDAVLSLTSLGATPCCGYTWYFLDTWDLETPDGNGLVDLQSKECADYRMLDLRARCRASGWPLRDVTSSDMVLATLLEEFQPLALGQVLGKIDTDPLGAPFLDAASKIVHSVAAYLEPFCLPRQSEQPTYQTPNLPICVVIPHSAVGVAGVAVASALRTLCRESDRMAVVPVLGLWHSAVRRASTAIHRAACVVEEFCRMQPCHDPSFCGEEPVEFIGIDDLNAMSCGNALRRCLSRATCGGWQRLLVALCDIHGSLGYFEAASKPANETLDNSAPASLSKQQGACQIDLQQEGRTLVDCLTAIKMLNVTYLITATEGSPLHDYAITKGWDIVSLNSDAPADFVDCTGAFVYSTLARIMKPTRKSLLIAGEAPQSAGDDLALLQMALLGTKEGIPPTSIPAKAEALSAGWEARRSIDFVSFVRYFLENAVHATRLRRLSGWRIFWDSWLDKASELLGEDEITLPELTIRLLLETMVPVSHRHVFERSLLALVCAWDGLTEHQLISAVHRSIKHEPLPSTELCDSTGNLELVENQLDEPPSGRNRKSEIGGASRPRGTSMLCSSLGGCAASLMDVLRLVCTKEAGVIRMRSPLLQAAVRNVVSVDPAMMGHCVARTLLNSLDARHAATASKSMIPAPAGTSDANTLSWAASVLHALAMKTTYFKAAKSPSESNSTLLADNGKIIEELTTYSAFPILSTPGLRILLRSYICDNIWASRALMQAIHRLETMLKPDSIAKQLCVGSGLSMQSTNNDEQIKLASAVLGLQIRVIASLGTEQSAYRETTVSFGPTDALVRRCDLTELVHLRTKSFVLLWASGTFSRIGEDRSAVALLKLAVKACGGYVLPEGEEAIKRLICLALLRNDDDDAAASLSLLVPGHWAQISSGVGVSGGECNAQPKIVEEGANDCSIGCGEDNGIAAHDTAPTNERHKNLADVRRTAGTLACAQEPCEHCCYDADFVEQISTIAYMKYLKCVPNTLSFCRSAVLAARSLYGARSALPLIISVLHGCQLIRTNLRHSATGYLQQSVIMLMQGAEENVLEHRLRLLDPSAFALSRSMCWRSRSDQVVLFPTVHDWALKGLVELAKLELTSNNMDAAVETFNNVALFWDAYDSLSLTCIHNDGELLKLCLSDDENCDLAFDFLRNLARLRRMQSQSEVALEILRALLMNILPSSFQQMLDESLTELCESGAKSFTEVERLVDSTLWGVLLENPALSRVGGMGGLIELVLELSEVLEVLGDESEQLPFLAMAWGIAQAALRRAEENASALLTGSDSFKVSVGKVGSRFATLLVRSGNWRTAKLVANSSMHIADGTPAALSVRTSVLVAMAEAFRLEGNYVAALRTERRASRAAEEEIVIAGDSASVKAAEVVQLRIKQAIRAASFGDLMGASSAAKRAQMIVARAKLGDDMACRSCLISADSAFVRGAIYEASTLIRTCREIVERGDVAPAVAGSAFLTSARLYMSTGSVTQAREAIGRVEHLLDCNIQENSMPMTDRFLLYLRLAEVLSSSASFKDRERALSWMDRTMQLNEQIQHYLERKRNDIEDGFLTASVAAVPTLPLLWISGVWDGPNVNVLKFAINWRAARIHLRMWHGDDRGESKISAHLTRALSGVCQFVSTEYGVCSTPSDILAQAVEGPGSNLNFAASGLRGECSILFAVVLLDYACALRTQAEFVSAREVISMVLQLLRSPELLKKGRGSRRTLNRRNSSNLLSTEAISLSTYERRLSLSPMDNGGGVARSDDNVGLRIPAWYVALLNAELARQMCFTTLSVPDPDGTVLPSVFMFSKMISEMKPTKNINIQGLNLSIILGCVHEESSRECRSPMDKHSTDSTVNPHDVDRVEVALKLAVDVDRLRAIFGQEHPVLKEYLFSVAGVFLSVGLFTKAQQYALEAVRAFHCSKALSGRDVTNLGAHALIDRPDSSSNESGLAHSQLPMEVATILGTSTGVDRLQACMYVWRLGLCYATLTRFEEANSMLHWAKDALVEKDIQENPSDLYADAIKQYIRVLEEEYACRVEALQQRGQERLNRIDQLHNSDKEAINRLKKLHESYQAKQLEYESRVGMMCAAARASARVDTIGFDASICSNPVEGLNDAYPSSPSSIRSSVKSKTCSVM
eukprot:Rmarinus@m.19183